MMNLFIFFLIFLSFSIPFLLSALYSIYSSFVEMNDTTEESTENSGLLDTVDEGTSNQITSNTNKTRYTHFSSPQEANNSQNHQKPIINYNEFIVPLKNYKIYIEESFMARCRLWFHNIFLFLSTAFSTVTFVMISGLYYRIPGAGNTCEFTQNFMSITLNNLRPSTGVVYCLMSLIINGLIILFSVSIFLLNSIILCRIIIYYSNSTLWNGFLMVSFIILWLLQLSTSILLIIGYAITCHNGVCSEGFWHHSTIALLGVIFSWISLLPLVSLYKFVGTKGKEGRKNIGEGVILIQKRLFMI
jgi:hypothetical protein